MNFTLQTEHPGAPLDEKLMSGKFIRSYLFVYRPGRPGVVKRP